MNSIERFNANVRAIEIPAKVSQIIEAKDKSGKTFEGGDFTIATFKAYAEKMGVVKPSKGDDRADWNECKAFYNEAKIEASRWYREQMGRALADERLAGRKMSVKLFRSKSGEIRRKVGFELADPTTAERGGSAPKKLTRSQLEAAAAQLGLQLVEQPELTLA